MINAHASRQEEDLLVNSANERFKDFEGVKSVDEIANKN